MISDRGPEFASPKCRSRSGMSGPRQWAYDPGRERPCRRSVGEAISVFDLSNGTQDALHGGETATLTSRRATHQEEQQSMRVRNITTCALGLAAALSFVASSESAAQSTDTTRLRRPADQRISISKGEVERPVIRVDTVYVTRYDTVRVD